MDNDFLTQLRSQLEETSRNLSSLTTEQRRQFEGGGDLSKILGKTTQLTGGRKFSNVYTPESLTPESEFQLSPYYPQTGVQGELAKFDTYTQDLERSAQQQEQKANSSFEDYLKAQLETPGKTELTARAEKKQGVPEIKEQLDDLDNQMRQEQQALARSTEATQTEAGLTKGQANARVEEIQRVSLRKQADIAVIRESVQQKYDSAKSIADRAVAIQVDQYNTRLNVLQQNADRNWDLFTTAEQRAFTAKQEDRQRQITQEENRSTRLYDLQIDLAKAGAPQSVISQIQDFDDAGKALSFASFYLAPSKSAKTEIIDIDGRKMLINSTTGEVIRDFGEFAGDIGEGASYQAEREGRIVSSIDELYERADAQTVGILSIGKVFPGSVQRDFSADLETLRANISFSELQAMRNASKTGGALGQVAVRELELLESTLGALDQGQSPANFRKNLLKIKESLTSWHDAVSKNINQTYTPGTIVEYKGKRYRVGSDGDTLIEL